MRCPGCLRPVKKENKYCPACGKRLHFFPGWVKIIVVVAVIVIIGILVWRYALSGSKGPPATYIPLIMPENVPVSTQPTVLKSQYVSSSTPIIDGVVGENEWGSPAMVEKLPYTVNGINKTGSISVYFMNNDTTLYFAMTVTAGDFRKELFMPDTWQFSVYLFFDGNNDGIISTGDEGRYYDLGLDPGNLSFINGFEDRHMGDESIDRDSSQDGRGVSSFIEDKSTFVYEGSIPLNSGDSEDLSAGPGDTLSLKIWFTQICVDSKKLKADFQRKWSWLATHSGSRDIKGYGKLVLTNKTE
jgi:hypothetical protein